jgi:ketosteroid isomerase-like protein
MSEPAATTPQTLAVAMVAAMNAHDIDAFVSLFADDYDSRQPAHPDRDFVSSAQVRKNWSTVFAGVADFRAELVGTAVEADTLWIEWRWSGTQEDGSPLDMPGVLVGGVRDGRLAWARLYMEPVESAGRGIEAAVRDVSGR